MKTTHGCGGTVLVGGATDQRHQYCDRCGAYTYDMDGELPSGANREANQEATDAGRDASPDQAETERRMAMTVSRLVGDDGTGDLGVIVRQALQDDASATAEGIAEIVRDARQEANGCCVDNCGARGGKPCRVCGQTVCPAHAASGGLCCDGGLEAHGGE